MQFFNLLFYFFIDNFKSPLGNSSLCVSVEAISPIPNPANSERTSKKRKRKDAQQACEITSSPYKEELAGKQKVKEAKPKSIFGKKKLKNDDNNNTKNCRSSKPSTSLCPDHDEADVGSTSSWYCLLCKVDKQIDMIQCQKCNKWVHALCANVSPLRKFYFCPICINSPHV